MAATPTQQKKKVHVTPVAECQWAKILEAEHNRFDPEKAPAYSIELLLDSQNPEHVQFLMEAEDLWNTYAEGKRKSIHAFPWQPHKDKSNLTVMRFKLPEFTRKDGSKSEGPRVVDALKRPWQPGVKVGNGSKVQIAFDVYVWDSRTGAGMTFQPKVVMVVDHVAYEERGTDPEEALEALDAIPSAGTATTDEAMDSLPFQQSLTEKEEDDYGVPF